MATAPALGNLLHSTGTLYPNSSSTALITPRIVNLADPSQHAVDSHLVDLLLNETIRILIESTRHAVAKRDQEQREIEHDLNRLGLAPAAPPADPPSRPDDVEDQVRTKLEQIGFKIGYSTAERLTRDRPKFPSTATTTPPPPSSSTAASSIPAIPVPDPLETIKFICKDVWVSLYDKQVDNLRTNHRGVYVLLDHRVRSLERLSPGSKGNSRQEHRELLRWSQFLLKVPEGVIRGALANLGLQVTVTSECTNIPQASFQIKTIKPGTGPA
ncbi:Trs33p [Sporobolomyces koalae]|uniref:Trs33p n=1 Tax=Sporobolomyces koalae TaxID=500713 RepID=UPI0031796D60